MRYLTFHELIRLNERSLKWRASALLGFLAAIWASYGVLAITPRGTVSPLWGVIPRTIHGLAGIVTAPFLHGDLDHITANTVPLFVLGAAILARGLSEYVTVVQIGVLTSGMGTWLFGSPGTQHIGASGVVFAFFGFLLFRTVFNPTWASAAVTIAVAVAYGTAIAFSLVPERGISWSGHAFGFVGGIIAARYIYRRKQAAERQASEIFASLGVRRAK